MLECWKAVSQFYTQEIYHLMSCYVMILGLTFVGEKRTLAPQDFTPYGFRTTSISPLSFEV